MVLVASMPDGRGWGRHDLLFRNDMTLVGDNFATEKKIHQLLNTSSERKKCFKNVLYK